MKIKTYIILFFLIVISLATLTFLKSEKIFFRKKYKEFKMFSKQTIGGIVCNNTDEILEITDYKYIRKLPPGKSTRDIGIFDADSLIITEPMYFEDNIYFNGVLKFCDYSSLEILKIDGVMEIKAKNVWICKLLNDFKFYNSVKDAFNG